MTDLDRNPKSDLAAPSKFWTALGRKHAQDVIEYGYDDIKRRQALRYFTWTWHVRSIGGSEQMRHLLRRTPLTAWLGSALARFAIRSGSWAPLVWSIADRWMYTAAIRLLWEFALRHGDRDVLRLAEPPDGNPLPVTYRGRLISQDLANSSLEVEAIRRTLGGRSPHSILEVGAGYGRTAYVLLSLYPGSVYTIVDIEPALSISRWYLSRLFPADRLRFLTPDQVEDVADGTVDLAVSISSLQEMTPGQVQGYIGLMDRVAAGGHVYLKQWATWRNPDDGVTMRFSEYPVPSAWIPTIREPAPVQERFVQAGWAVPPLSAAETS